MVTSTTHSEQIQWREDEDGFLRITMCVLRGGVFDYAKKDLPTEVTRTSPDKEVWKLNIQDQFSDEFLKSIEGKPVIIYKHDWQEVQTIQPEEIKGSIAGSARVEGNAIVVDAVITDADTIALIKTGNLVEVSAGYNSNVDIAEDKDYDAEQIPTNANHFVLLPKGEGRCGHSVRIINTKKETVMVKVKIKNSSGNEAEYQFTNEADAQVAETMVKEETVAHTGEMEAKNHELASAQARFAEINQALTGLQAEKTILEQKLKEFESEEYQEAQLMEREQYKSDESAVIENACNTSEEKQEVEAKLQNAKSVKERMGILTAHVCNSKGIPYDEANKKVLFGVLVKTLNKATVTVIRQPAKQEAVKEINHPIFRRG